MYSSKKYLGYQPRREKANLSYVKELATKFIMTRTKNSDEKMFGRSSEALSNRRT